MKENSKPFEQMVFVISSILAFCNRAISETEPRKLFGKIIFENAKVEISNGTKLWFLEDFSGDSRFEAHLT